jgi:hypothetical protein
LKNIVKNILYFLKMSDYILIVVVITDAAVVVVVVVVRAT